MLSRKYRGRIIFAALLIVLAALLPMWILREPVYGGHSLSEWLADGNSSRQVTNNLQESRFSRAEAAVRAIGPKAIPHLLRMLSAKESSLGELRRDLWNEWASQRYHAPSPWQQQHRGFVGLQMLGPAAAPALPKIIGMLERGPNRMELWFLLESIGPSSAVAEPLLARAFPDLAKNTNFAAPRPNVDFHPQWLASDLLMTWGGSYRAQLADQLRTTTNSVVQRVSALWAFRKDPEYARQFMDAIAHIVADGAEPPLLKNASLHTLGRMPNPDPALITRAIESYEAQFGPFPVGLIHNGDFTRSAWSNTNQIPADPKAPSTLMTNWLTWSGVIGRNLSPAWIGSKIELAPRSPPGSISQAFRTTAGALYQLHFEAATGRNIRAHVSVGDLDTIYYPSSNDPAKPSRFTFEFRAVSPLTTLTFGALDHEGYGPFIDNIVVEAKRPGGE